ncbi:hypothetical protein CHS0354_030603 [Potamilus streckersoni]|uniref:Uncharacterized protein n=1 Tax=Potamilus streckersoni TaxID=2493646 RepID=A0AAE0SCP9_9BIVA|nr:hypothetical protein CHS0354_030603 [Potamilus streckersoni]
MSTTVEDAPVENPVSEDSGKVSSVKGGYSKGVASCEQTTDGGTTSPFPCPILEYTLSASNTLLYTEDLQPVTDAGDTKTEILVPAETDKEAAAEQEGDLTDDQATTDKPKEWEDSGEDSEVESKGETEERSINLKDFEGDDVSTESGKEGDEQNQEIKYIPVEDNNSKQNIQGEDLGVEPQSHNVEDKLPECDYSFPLHNQIKCLAEVTDTDESVVPVITMSSQESQEPVITMSTQESQEPVTTISTQESQEPVTTISTQESQEPDTMEKEGPEPEEQTPAEQPVKTRDDGTEGESKLEQGPEHGSVLVPDDTIEKADQRGEQAKEEEEKKEEERKKEVKNEKDENKDENDKQDEVLESTLQNQTAEKEAFDKLLDENVKLKTENERLKSEHADISDKYTTFNQEKEQMMKTQAEQEKEIKGLHQEVEDLRKGLGDDLKVQELQNKLLQLTKEHEAKDKRIHSLQLELDSTKGKLLEAESKLERNGTAKQDASTSKTCAVM